MRAKIEIVLSVLLVLVVCFGCATSNVGKSVSADEQIPLKKGGPHSGVSKAFDYTMSYKYTFIQESGRIEMSGKIQSGPDGLSSLDIWINFIDGQGKILDEKSLYSVGFRESGNRYRAIFQFSKKLETPQGAEAISFRHIDTTAAGRRR